MKAMSQKSQVSTEGGNSPFTSHEGVEAKEGGLGVCKVAHYTAQNTATTAARIFSRLDSVEEVQRSRSGSAVGIAPAGGSGASAAGGAGGAVAAVAAAGSPARAVQQQQYGGGGVGVAAGVGVGVGVGVGGRHRSGSTVLDLSHSRSNSSSIGIGIGSPDISGLTRKFSAIGTGFGIVNGIGENPSSSSPLAQSSAVKCDTYNLAKLGGGVGPQSSAAAATGAIPKGSTGQLAGEAGTGWSRINIIIIVIEPIINGSNCSGGCRGSIISHNWRLKWLGPDHWQYTDCCPQSPTRSQASGQLFECILEAN
ncbi:fibroin heavy chain-like [Drosophila willistoni]|uniref:fibroin heavy chain-like n=1 Tax=Drosophila willistoni TaxID=7260 RepID=UPI000C26C2C2|nr:fibroin heavy chain-like [Drosophila willistoni]